MSKPTYLSKGGKSFGPFDEKEMATLRSSGELDNFGFIWDARFRKWAPLHELPPAPAMPQAMACRSGIQAIVHDRLHVITGSLEEVTDAGCELVTTERSHRPYFAPEARVLMNLLDPESGRSTNLLGKLKGARLTAAGWRYELAWEGRPEALESL
jgi:hypothetical protein